MRKKNIIKTYKKAKGLKDKKVIIRQLAQRDLYQDVTDKNI